ncbi:FxsA family protein [Thalassolituus sp. LLYu03]|uniref:FxsA family protein n=1 Tax=Thalassolituus sp. LLYu03 TaxID=3421656 RepID=UPI003D29CBCF
MPLFLIFIVLPVVELAVLIKVGSHIGVLWTLLLIFLTATIGVTLLRAQGLATLMRASRKLEEGAVPAAELAEGFLLALAGALLITPGFVTDAIGFSLLVPGVRQSLVGSVLKMLKVRAVSGMRSSVFGNATVFRDAENAQREERIHRNSNGTNTIEGEYRRED